MNGPREPFEDVMVTTLVFNALEIAATRRDGRPIGTSDILLGILAIDGANGWDQVQLDTTYVTDEAATAYPDPQPEADGVWHGIPLTRTATTALATAARIASDYRLLPLPTGVLGLGLLAEPEAGAAQALLDGAERDHAGLLDSIQDNVLDVELEDLDIFETAARRREGGGTLQQIGRLGRRLSEPTVAGKPDEAGATGGDGAPFVARALARAKTIDESPDPSSLALMIAAIELSGDSELDELLGWMLLDADELRMTARQLDLDDTPATDVLIAARRRFGDALDPAALLVAIALERSPRVVDALKGLALTPEELAAQVSEWRLRQAGDDTTDGRVVAAGLLNMLFTIATNILFFQHLVVDGGWWRLVLLPFLWWGYPQEGPVAGGAIAGVVALIVSPLVGACQALAALGDVLQAREERRVLWERTGVRLSLRQQRHVTQRFLNDRSRTLRMMRQGMAMRLQGSGDRLADLAE